MKVESGIRPKNKFIIENIKDNTCEVVFFDDIVEQKRKRNEEEAEDTIYTYNVYKISTFYRENLEKDIKDSIDVWLDYVKSLDYEKKATEIRKIRNKLLDESDKEMVIDKLNFDIPKSLTTTTLLSAVKNLFNILSEMQTGEWSTYRQELRDITKQDGFPYNVVFPEKPSK